MRIGIALPTLSDGDAVGNDAQAMARLLRRRGHDVDFFAWNGNSKEPIRLLDELPKALRRPDDVLIYHHSIGCEPGVRAVERLPCRKVVRYHNVTPPEFFAKTAPHVAEGCALGIRQVKRLADTDARIWAASGFNADHVREMAPGRAVDELPPFHQADALLKVEPDYRAVAGLDDWNTNLLLIGRVVPNKNIPLALRTFAEYRGTYDKSARLVVVGDRPLADHAAEVDKLARTLGVDAHTIVTGKVSVAQLKALYLTADVLLVTSKHEGFCVPLVEAMGLRVPVVAVPAAAVPFTAGDAARFADADPEMLAAEIHAVLADPEARERQIARGWRRFADTFTTAAIEQRFEALFDELVAG